MTYGLGDKVMCDGNHPAQVVQISIDENHIVYTLLLSHRPNKYGLIASEDRLSKPPNKFIAWFKRVRWGYVIAFSLILLYGIVRVYLEEMQRIGG